MAYKEAVTQSVLEYFEGKTVDGTFNEDDVKMLNAWTKREELETQRYNARMTMIGEVAKSILTAVPSLYATWVSRQNTLTLANENRYNLNYEMNGNAMTTTTSKETAKGITSGFISACKK